MSGKKMLDDDIATEIKCFTKALPHIIYDTDCGNKEVNHRFLNFSVYDFAVSLEKRFLVLINRSLETLGIKFHF